MTRALALRLEGPMQAWGALPAGDDRPTRDAPTKSGVIGLIAGALGIHRDNVRALSRLHELGFVVRVDRAGQAGSDYQTILDVPKADHTIRDYAVVSRRGYLYDAAFTILLVERRSLDPTLDPTLDKMNAALLRPHYLPYLGRKACPPSGRISLGVREGASWREILALVKPPEERKRERAGSPTGEIFADADLLTNEERGKYPVQRVRDVTSGPEPRFFAERSFVRLPRAEDEL